MDDERIIYLSKELVKALRARQRSSERLLNDNSVQFASRGGGGGKGRATLEAKHSRNCEYVVVVKEKLKDLL